MPGKHSGRITTVLPIGLSQASEIDSGAMMPQTAPAVAAVQSVSMPQLTAVQMVLPKSPPPASRASTVIGTFGRTQETNSVAQASQSRFLTVNQSPLSRHQRQT